MQILTNEQLARIAPAAVATERDEARTSNRYGMVNTLDVLDAFKEEGFWPVGAGQPNPRFRNPNGIVHRVTLRHEDDIAKGAAVGMEVPQIILMNSHNGRTKFSLRGGFYRFVCSNGIVVGDDRFYASANHTSDARAVAMQYATNFTAQIARLRDQIERWGAIEMSRAKVEQFAEQAAILRFGDRAQAYTADAILEAHRAEDEGRTLWEVFNRAQENLTKGGVAGRSANNRRVVSREIKDVGKDVAFNEQLWRLADGFAEAA